MKPLNFIILILLTVCLPTYSQISFGGLPASSLQTRLRAAESIPCITIKPDTTQEVEANQFAFPNEVNINISENASSLIAGEKIIYRLLIHSKNAKSINLIFNPISLPQNAKMYLSRPDGGEIYGAYTKESFVGDVFATTPVSGDSVMIQCEVPIANSDSFSATISSVNVGFSELRMLPATGKAKLCETDIVCENDGMENQSRAACLIIINGIRYCSGTLVATKDNDYESFVLTSAHCLRNNRDVFDSTLARTCVFYFGYNSALCETKIVGSYEKSISGSRVASSHPGKDMALLKLSQRPPVDYTTYESGWNIELAPHGPVTCIHHPSGDIMKISISDHDPSPISFAVEGLEKEAHWLVDEWSVGITEEGSSGAPLYDANGLIIGALSGGLSECSSRGDDKFWRLYKVWEDKQSTPSDIMSVLDPSRSGIIQLEGRENHNRPCFTLKNYDQFSEVDEPYIEGYGYASGTNSFGLEEFAEKFTSPYESTEIHGVSFIPIIGKYSETHPVYLRIYTGDSLPEKLVYESVVKITAKEYKSPSGLLTNSDIKNWSYKENYIRLDSVVTAEGKFFISFYNETEDIDNGFAMLTASSEKGSDQTAFFKKNGTWESWESHPFNNSVGSLLVSAVVRKKNNSGVKNLTDDGMITVYPNPAKETISFKCSDEIKDVRIYNSLGRFETCPYDRNANYVVIKALSNGIYSAEITTDKGKYHTKFIKE